MASNQIIEDINTYPVFCNLYKFLDQDQKFSISGTCKINDRFYYVYVSHDSEPDASERLNLTLSHFYEEGYDLLYCEDITNIDISNIRKEFVNDLETQELLVSDSDIEELTVLAQIIQHQE